MSLRTLKVRDLMQKDVVTLSMDAPIREAVAVFEEYRISGAPVVDAGGTVVGILAAADIARSEHLAEDRITEHRGDWYLADPLDEYEEADYGWDEADLEKVTDYSPETNGPEHVRDWMNPRIVSVLGDASIEHACKVMVEERIHRVLVLEDGKLQGILTTFDVVAAVAHGGTAAPPARPVREPERRAKKS